MLIPEDLRRDLEDQMKSDGYEQLGPYIRFIVKNNKNPDNKTGPSTSENNQRFLGQYK